MFLNEYKIDWVKSWNIQFNTSVKKGFIGNYIKPKFDKLLDIENKIKFRVNHEPTARQLKELFSNTRFNTIVISDFYREEYNGIYQLVKGNISLDDSKEFWEGTVWLENNSDDIRFSYYQQEFEDDDFKTLQTSTSNIASLLNYTQEVGSWSGSSGVTSSGNGYLSFGYDYWNSYVVSSDITLGSSTQYAGFVLNFQNTSNTYFVYISNHSVYDVKVSKTVNGTSTVLAQLDTNLTLQANGTYNLKVVFSGRKIDVYVDNSFVCEIYDRDIVSGKVGLYSAGGGDTFNNIEVLKYYSPSLTIPAGISGGFEPHDDNYIYADSILENHQNVNADIIKEILPSRVLNGEVKVWDTMSNNFESDNIHPKRILWERVYNTSHVFKGNMYIENELFGILYTNSGIYHYIYDTPYKKGQLVWLDFRQTPCGKIWNESIINGEFESLNQGYRNWTEEGLVFDDNPNETTQKKDIVATGYSQGNIADLQEVDGHLMDYMLEIKFKADNSKYIDGIGSTYGTLAGNSNDSTKQPFLVYYDYSNEKVFIGMEENTPSNNSYYYSTDNNSIPANEWIHLKIYKLHSQDGILVYKNGLLINQFSLSYKYEHDLNNGVFTVGGDKWSSYNFNGVIQYVRLRNLSKGEIIPRVVDTPLVRYTFDEDSYDTLTNKFKDSGSKGLDIYVYGDPTIYKNGRYNEAIRFYDSADYLRVNLTTELDNLSVYTMQFWVLYEGTPSNWDYLIKFGASTPAVDKLGYVYIDASNNLVFNIYDSTTYYSVIVSSANQTVYNDRKWHHIAMQVDFPSGKMYGYIDGELKGTTTIPTTPFAQNPEYIVISNGEAAIIDEFMIHDWIIPPELFGYINHDAFEQGQWYSKSEVERVDGVLRKRDNTVPTILEIDFNNESTYKFSDRVKNNSISRYSGSNNPDISIRPSYSGLGLTKYNGDRLAIDVDYDIMGDEFRISREKDWTMQWYLYLDSLPSTEGVPFRLIDFRQEGTSYSRFDMYLNTSNQLVLYADGVETVVGSFSAAVDTIYHFVVTMKFDYEGSTGGTASFYVNNTLISEVTIYNLHNEYTGGTSSNYLAIFGTGYNFRGWLSNLMFHQKVLPTDMWGIEVDYEDSVPVYYAKIKNTQTISDVIERDIVDISPELVVVNLYPISKSSGDKVEVQSWIESGMYFYKWDMYSSLFNDDTSYKETFSYEIKYNRYMQRFALLLGDTINFIDMAYTQTTGNVVRDGTSSENHLLSFDNKACNMITVFGGSANTNSLHYYIYHSNRKISEYHTLRGAGFQFAGVIPQRHVNHMFLDATSLAKGDVSVTYTNVSSDWFKSATITTGSASAVSTEELLNFSRFKRGGYLVIVRAYASSDGWQARFYNNTNGVQKFISTEYTNTSFSNEEIYLHVDSHDENDKMLIQAGVYDTTSNTMVVDYIVIVPLTDGIGMVLDLISQSIGKREKLKVLH